MQNYNSRFNLFLVASAALIVALWPVVTLTSVLVVVGLAKLCPDRLMAWVVAVLAAPAAIMLVLVTERQWAGAVLIGRSTFGAVWPSLIADFVAGACLGALAWQVWSRRRERNPYAGEDARKKRFQTEEKRRRWTTQTAQEEAFTGNGMKSRVAKAVAVPLGDKHGPYLGVAQRGDLKGKWKAKNRFVRLPMNDPSNRHMIALGATGMGKTETAYRAVEWAVEQGWQVIWLTCKEPPSAEESSVGRLAAIAEKHGQKSVALVPGVSPYDPMRGSGDEVRDRLIRIEEWGDRYWAHCANLLVGLAIDLSEEAGQKLESVPDLVYTLIHGRLQELADKSEDSRVAELVEALDKSALSGALVRYASMALHLRGWVGTKSVGGWALEDADVACIEFPTSSRPEAGAALMRLVLRDLGSYLVDDDRRHKSEDGSPRPVLVAIEEVGAVVSDSVIGGELVNLVERARSAGAKALMTAQDLVGLGNEETMSALVTNCTIITGRQTKQAEAIAGLAGTERVDEGGADYSKRGRSMKGVTRRQYAFKLNPQVIRQMKMGDLAVINSGEFQLVAGAMSEFGYRLPDSDVVKEAIRKYRLGMKALPSSAAAPVMIDLPQLEDKEKTIDLEVGSTAIQEKDTFS